MPPMQCSERLGDSIASQHLVPSRRLLRALAIRCQHFARCSSQFARPIVSSGGSTSNSLVVLRIAGRETIVASSPVGALEKPDVRFALDGDTRCLPARVFSLG